LLTFDYKGRHRYFVTCSTAWRYNAFTDSDIVTAATDQILRTCGECEFEVLAYVFMENHVHLLIEGSSENSNFTRTMTLLRQRTALVYSRTRGKQRWQDGYYERVLRPSDDVFEIIRYIRENPAKAGLAGERTGFPYVWWIAGVNPRATGVCDADADDDRRHP
jgi:REP element-mobilizing transposase RayT